MTKMMKDQTGRSIEIVQAPERIVSLVPSQTELLFFFKMEGRLAGITDYCIYPEDKTAKIKKVGGPKTLDIQKIEEIQPDLIIANKEENSKKQIEELEKKYPVWVSDVRCLDDALSMIESIGLICGQEELAHNITENISKSMLDLNSESHIKVAYMIWENPYMTVGSNTFINDILNKLGYINVFEHLPRYPKIGSKQLAEAEADFVLLSSEPYPFTSVHIEKLKKLCPRSKILLVNGQYFSWYGNRLLPAISYFKSIKNIINTLHGK